MISIPYGKTYITIDLENSFDANPDLFLPPLDDTIAPMNKIDVMEAISKAIDIETSSQSTTVAITINDATRPIPYDTILPPLLDLLDILNIKRGNISFFIATGSHRAPTEQEFDQILNKNIREKYRTYVHNCDDEENLTYLGCSSAGTPIYINKDFCEADIRIVTGHIEPHHFMGFSGGVKSAVIGLGGRKTIEANHRMLINPMSKMGNFFDNPMRMDIEEMGTLIGIDYALNAVLNDTKEIMHVLFGSPADVIKKGIKLSRQACQVHGDGDYDLVICSAGGYPKDINLYQAQKAFTHACAFVKENGVVLLLAECRNGLGSEAFENFIAGKNEYQEIIDHFEKGPFMVGPHKAYQLALQAKCNKLILLSDLPSQNGLNALLEQTTDFSDAIKICKEYTPEKPKIAVLPYATHVIRG